MAQTLLNINQYGATYGGTSNAYQFYLVVTLNSQSTANNTSNITVTHSANGRNGWGYSGFSTPTSAITVGGTQRVSSTVAGIPTNGSSVTLSTWTGNVTHNNDGTLSLAVSATYNPNTTGYSYVPRTNTLSGTITLPTIPRASDVSVSNYTISNTTGSLSATITSRANFYHRWRWKVGSGSWSGWNNKGLIATTSSTVTVSNSNLLSRMPNDKSATFTIEVATYSDSNYANYVGTKSASATLTVTIKPSVSLGNIAINTSPISGYAVAGYSTVKATWSATAGSGASNGTTYFTISTGSVTASSSTASSGTVTSTTVPGSASNYTLTITAYTVDSRGLRSDEVSKSITVYGYQPPTATLSAYRVADATSTTEDGAGVYVYVTFSGAVRSSVNSQNSVQSTTCTYSGSISGTATSGQHIALADSQNATFTLTVTDKVTSSTAIVSVAPALYPLDLYDNGQGTVGVGFGTTAESGKVKSALPLEVNGNATVNGVVYSNLDSRPRFTANDRVIGGSIYLGWNSNHQTHGLWSSGYSTDGSTFTESNQWILYRNQNGNTALAGGNCSINGTSGSITTAGGLTANNEMMAQANGQYARLRLKDTTHNGEIRIGWGSNHTSHGLYSTGYSADGSTWTASGMWLLYRNASGTLSLVDGKAVIDTSGNMTLTGALKGCTATVTATLASSATFTTLSYPSGFTVSNSVIINWAINTNTASSPAWATGHGLASGSDRTFVQQNDTNILFYNNQSAYYGKTVRVVLMKIG